jgi:integrase
VRHAADGQVVALPPLSVQSQAHILADLRCAFRFGVDEGWLGSSPFRQNMVPRRPEVEPPRLSDDEVARVVAMPEPWGFVARFLVDTGLRWNEAVNVEMRHVRDRAVRGMRRLSGCGRCGRISFATRLRVAGWKPAAV